MWISLFGITRPNYFNVRLVWRAPWVQAEVSARCCFFRDRMIMDDSFLRAVRCSMPRGLRSLLTSIEHQATPEKVGTFSVAVGSWWRWPRRGQQQARTAVTSLTSTNTKHGIVAPSRSRLLWQRDFIWKDENLQKRCVKDRTRITYSKVYACVGVGWEESVRPAKTLRALARLPFVGDFGMLAWDAMRPVPGKQSSTPSVPSNKQLTSA